MTTSAPRRLRMGMIGGGQGAFIGAVHRIAARLDADTVPVDLVAGAFSSDAARSRASGAALGVEAARAYGSWQEMLKGELAMSRQKRVDFVSIVTPNNTHFPIAKAFAEARIHVICDKPLCTTSTDGAALVAAVAKSKVVFAVTYNYSGYPMVKQARDLVRSGQLGDIRKVIAEYTQGWLATHLEASGQKQAAWRTDPALAGAGGAIGDIGSHAEQLAAFVTGLEIESLCADITAFVPGRKLDDDANLLLRFKGGAKGILTASQICVGNENDLRLRVWGTKGGLEWRQEDPNQLTFKPMGEPERIYRRANAYTSPAASAACRIPAGHPEAFLEAFANVYKNACSAILAAEQGRDSAAFDYPTVAEGARGVRFIEAVVKSSNAGAVWTSL